MVILVWFVVNLLSVSLHGLVFPGEGCDLVICIQNNRNCVNNFELASCGLILGVAVILVCSKCSIPKPLWTRVFPREGCDLSLRIFCQGDEIS